MALLSDNIIDKATPTEWLIPSQDEYKPMIVALKKKYPVGTPAKILLREMERIGATCFVEHDFKDKKVRYVTPHYRWLRRYTAVCIYKNSVTFDTRYTKRWETYLYEWAIWIKHDRTIQDISVRFSNQATLHQCAMP